MKYLFNAFLLLISCLNFDHTLGNQEETQLRNTLFSNYNPKVRPVQDISSDLTVEMGLALQNIEKFDQMQESITLNAWIRQTWNDYRLSWNSTQSNLTFISVSKTQVWVPDTELLNAAGLPEIYTLKGGLMLYSDGTMFYSNPVVLKMPCSLELETFPFDTQTCSMVFGSWVYSSDFLNLIPYNDEEKQIDVLDSFSHTEWEIDELTVEMILREREGHINEEFNELEYSIVLSRFPHYYKLSMGMTIALVLVSFIIMLMEPSNVSRTSTAVFIPLTILALQLTLADKIPVVGYFTLMDNFFLCCFITSMLVSIESGLIYSLITTESTRLYSYLVTKVDLTKLLEKDQKKIKLRQKTKVEHSEEIDVLALEQNDNNNNTDTKQLENRIAETEFSDASKILENLNGESSSDPAEITDGTMAQEAMKDEIDAVENSDKSISISSHSSHYDNFQNYVKTIPYNDKLLKLTYKERLVYGELIKWVKCIDNVFRVLMPIIFLSYIGSLLAVENT
jgi:hypothetical protein